MQQAQEGAGRFSRTSKPEKVARHCRWLPHNGRHEQTYFQTPSLTRRV